MNYVYFGIDPGFTGAIALWRPQCSHLEVMDMPTIGAGKQRQLDVPRVIDFLDVGDRPIKIVAIEQAQAMPSGLQGRQQGIASTARYMMGYGILLGILGTLSLPFYRAHPAVWKRKMAVPKDKDEARAIAARSFPAQTIYFKRKKDHGRAEAALLARFAQVYL